MAVFPIFQSPLDMWTCRCYVPLQALQIRSARRILSLPKADLSFYLLCLELWIAVGDTGASSLAGLELHILHEMVQTMHRRPKLTVDLGMQEETSEAP